MNVGQATGRGLAVLCGAAVVGGCGSARLASTVAPLRLGFESDPVLVSGPAALRAPWIARAVAAGAGIVRVNVDWSSVTSDVRSPGFRPADSYSVGYRWGSVDSAVRSLTAAGLTVCLTLYRAPAWAEGAHRPPGAEPGSWRPSVSDFAQFATAAALRYDGRSPDPTRPGAHLPRVRCWQAWNEPNINFYLAPQFVRTRHRWSSVGPQLYRRLLDGFYAAVKRVSRSNFVLMGGTAPFGLAVERTAPVAFYRRLFCLRGPALKPYGCPVVYLDGVDHHPQAPAGPFWHAPKADDVAVPDIYKVSRVLSAAVRDGHVLPRGRKAVWVSELEWSSRPPLKRGLPALVVAHWYEQAFYELWRQGVSTVTLLELADPGPFPGHPNVFQSGLYYHDGSPKAVLTAYRFPFVIERQDGRRVQIWGRAPLTGRLRIEARRAGTWRVIRTLTVRRWQVFTATVGFRGLATWRAQVGSQTSLSQASGATSPAPEATSSALGAIHTSRFGLWSSGRA